MLMFGESTMAVFWAAAAMMSQASCSRPVVPMIMLTPCAAQYPTCPSVPAGRVKSIRKPASARPLSRSEVMATPARLPRKAAASLPRLGESGTSRAPVRIMSSAFWMASISMRPMRPEAPATAIFRELIGLETDLPVRDGGDDRRIGQFRHGVFSGTSDQRQVFLFGRQVVAAFIAIQTIIAEEYGYAAAHP